MTPKPLSEPACPACGSPMDRVGSEIAKCRRCSGCFGWHVAKRRWVRLANLFIGTGCPKPRRRPCNISIR